VPNELAGAPVHFLTTFLDTVDLATAFPSGDGDPALLPLVNLEIWGAVTSQPQADPTNANYIYQRFQRGIMHYRAECACTERILLADWFKSVIIGQANIADRGGQANAADPGDLVAASVSRAPVFDALPADLAADMAGSPFYLQWRPGARWSGAARRAARHRPERRIRARPAGLRDAGRRTRPGPDGWPVGRAGWRRTAARTGGPAAARTGGCGAAKPRSFSRGPFVDVV